VYIQEKETSDLGWFVKTMVSPAGHEDLTRHAARGLGLSKAELALVIEGVRRPDTASLPDHIKPGEQRRHVLRRTIFQSSKDARDDAVAHLRALHARILGPGQPSDERFRLIGEALHLVQDAYAPAHVHRGPGGRILYIRNFGPTNLLPRLPLRDEHGFPVDLRDNISTRRSGMLRPEAGAAVDASRHYLGMALRHLRRPPPPARITADLNAFVERHFRI
jgi:hypothetical protein